MDLLKASRKLSELDLKIKYDNLLINVMWFRVMPISAKKGWVIGRHMHSSFEFHFISSGSCRVLLDDGEFDVGPGEFYLTAPGVYHEQRLNLDMGFVEYCINYDFRMVDEAGTEAAYILKTIQNAPCCSVKDIYGAIKLFDEALNEAYNQNIGFYNNIKSFVVLILNAAARDICVNYNIKYDIPYKNIKDENRIINIEKFIGDNIASPISTADIARHMYLSEKQVCRIVADKKGITTKQLIKQIKLQKAKELLRKQNIPIRDISNMLGFSSEYYFSQFFKREEGYSPGSYRNGL